MQPLLAAFMQQSELANAQGVSNVLYGIAKCGQQLEPVQVRQLLRQLASCLGDAKPQEIANTVWAVATMGQHVEQQQLQQLLGALIDKLQDATLQNVSNTLWAVATTGQQVEQQQLQLLLKAFACKVQDANPQNIANTLWAVATMGQQVEQQQLLQLLGALMGKLHDGIPRDVSNTLWAVATMGQQIEQQQLQQLLNAFACKAQDATPQNIANTLPQGIANTLWAVATMGRQLEQQQLQQLLGALMGKVRDANPQNIANTLWAVAIMAQQIEQHQLQQLLGGFAAKLSEAHPQDVCNTLWACGQLGYLPKQLLAAPKVLQVVSAAEPLELGQIAVGCAQLGHRDEQLMAALVQQAVRRLASEGGKGSGSSGLGSQALCNICWSIAVLDMQQLVPDVLQLVQACRQQWDSLVAEGLRQLHTWLLDCQLAEGQGLLPIVTQQQLQQCRDARVEQLVQAQQRANAAVGRFHRAVFDAVSQLSLDWLEPPQMEQLSVGKDGEVDGAALIDITAVAADGTRLAIEVDGPSHFRQPDGALTGPTQFRNRLLAARGYSVISIPYREWEWGNSEVQQQYLMQLLLGAAKYQRQATTAAGGMQLRQRSSGAGQKSLPAQAPNSSSSNASRTHCTANSSSTISKVTTGSRVRRFRRRADPPSNS